MMRLQNLHKISEYDIMFSNGMIGFLLTVLSYFSD